MKPRTLRPFLWLPAATALFLVTWLGWTRAEPWRAALAGGAPGEPGSQDSIAVVLRDEEPAWKRELRRKVEETRVELDLESAPLADVLARLSEQSGASILVHPRLHEDHPDLELDLHVSGRTVAEVLDAICERHELRWELERGAAVLVPEHVGQVFSTELRFYRIAPLVAGIDDPERRRDRLEELVDLVRETGAPDPSWAEEPPISISLWRDTLMVQQTARMQGRVHAFLDQLLRRGVEADGEEAWRTELLGRLEAPITLELEETEVERMVEMLREAGVPLVVDRELAESGATVTGRFEGVSRRHALEWIAQLLEARLELREGGVWLGHSPRLETGVFAVDDLVAGGEAERAGDRRDELEDALRRTVDPDSWDVLETSLRFWGDLLVVRQTNANLRRCAQTLAAMRRSL